MLRNPSKTYVTSVQLLLEHVTHLRIKFFGLALLCSLLLIPSAYADAASGRLPASLSLVYPGFNDDGANKVPIMEAIRPGTSTIIVFTEKPPTQSYKDKWRARYKNHGGINQVEFLDSKSLNAQGGAINYLTKLQKQGTSSIILNIDMDVSHNFARPIAKEGFLLPLGKGRKEQAWAGDIGVEFSTAHKQVFKRSEIGFISHSYGNGAANHFLKQGGKAEYGIMASPGAMRDTLNDLAARIPKNNLLVLTAEGDFHGQTTYDGPMNFQHVKLLNPKHPHSSMVMMKNLKTVVPYVTNQSKLRGQPLIDHFRALPPSNTWRPTSHVRGKTSGSFGGGGGWDSFATPSESDLKIQVGRTAAENLADSVFTYAKGLKDIDKQVKENLPFFKHTQKLTDRETQFLRIGKYVKDAYDLGLVIEKDIRTSSGPDKVDLRLDTVEALGKFGIDTLNFLNKSLKLEDSKNLGRITKGALKRLDGFQDIALGLSKNINRGKIDLDVATHYIDGIKELAKVHLEVREKLTGKFAFLDGLQEIGTAGVKHYQNKKADVEIVTQYLDGVNSLVWTGLGVTTCAGNHACTIAIQKIGTAAAKVGRDSTEGLFKTGWLKLRGQDKKLVKEWTTLQQKRIQLGLPLQKITEVYGKKLLKDNGLSDKQIRRINEGATTFQSSFFPRVKSRDAHLDSILAPSTRPIVSRDVGGVDLNVSRKETIYGDLDDIKRREERSRSSSEQLFYDIAP